MRIFFSLFASIVCLIIGLIPEITMYFLWGVINPETAALKALTIAIFVFGGGGLCFAFGVIAFVLWVAVMQAIIEV